jgi:hypothetical protein
VSKLELYQRPLMIFDAANKQHRQYYFNFIKTGSWHGCPYRWAIPDDVGNLQGMIQRKLLDHYMGKEFKGVVKTPQTLIRQKKKKTVDKAGN